MLALRIGGFVMCYRVSLRPRTRRMQVPYLHPNGERESVRRGHRIRTRNTRDSGATTRRTLAARRRSRPRSASGKGADQRFMCRISAGGHALPGRRGTNSQQPGACGRRPRSGRIDAERRVCACGAVLRDVSRPSRRRRRRRSSTSCSHSGFAQRIPPDWTSSAPLLRPEGPS